MRLFWRSRSIETHFVQELGFNLKNQRNQLSLAPNLALTGVSGSTSLIWEAGDSPYLETDGARVSGSVEGKYLTFRAGEHRLRVREYWQPLIPFISMEWGDGEKALIRDLERLEDMLDRMSFIIAAGLAYFVYHAFSLWPVHLGFLIGYLGLAAVWVKKRNSARRILLVANVLSMILMYCTIVPTLIRSFEDFAIMPFVLPISAVNLSLVYSLWPLLKQSIDARNGRYWVVVSLAKC